MGGGSITVIILSYYPIEFADIWEGREAGGFQEISSNYLILISVSVNRKSITFPMSQTPPPKNISYFPIMMNNYPIILLASEILIR